MRSAIMSLIGGLAVVSCVLTLPAGAVEWRGWNIHGDGYPNTTAMDKFAELVAKKTDGRITLKMFHSGTLGNQPDAIEQARIGALEVGNFNLGPLGPTVPEANVVSLPFIFASVDHMHKAMDGDAGDKISEGMAKKGLVALAWYDSGARSFYNTKKPINTPADMGGMKIRVMNNELFSGMVNELGGNASPMAFAEVYQALKTGVVDGAENSWPSYESTGHFEVAGFYSLSQHLIIPECVCINATTYNGLSDADKQAVKEAATESADLQRQLWEKRAALSREKVMASGVKFNEIADKIPFQAAMKPVYDKFLESNSAVKPIIALIQAAQ